MTDHHGAMLRAELLKKGKAFSSVAKELGVSRAWLYQMFEKDTFSAKDIRKLGTYFPYELSASALKPKGASPSISVTEPSSEIQYWKDKYYALLEEHILLLKKIT